MTESIALELHKSVSRGLRAKLVFALPGDSGGLEWVAVKYDTGQAAKLIRNNGIHFVCTMETTVSLAEVREIVTATEKRRRGILDKWIS